MIPKSMILPTFVLVQPDWMHVVTFKWFHKSLIIKIDPTTQQGGQRLIPSATSDPQPKVLAQVDRTGICGEATMFSELTIVIGIRKATMIWQRQACIASQ